MEYIIRNIALPLLDISPENEFQLLKKASARLAGIPENDIEKLRIVKESLDARKKNALVLVYSVAVSVRGPLKAAKDIVPVNAQEKTPVFYGTPTTRPVIAGAGPCGLFCAWELVERGFSPIVVERGEEVEKRSESVKRFWSGHGLNPESNVQFGEGGAGTFSDGKLTTRINDPRAAKVLETLHEMGAPGDILYKAKPHIGTDILRCIIRSMRERLIARGATFLFSTRVEELLISGDRVCGVKLSDGNEIHSDAVVMAIGHSARDTFRKLLEQGVAFVQKAFSVGVRIEHLQEWINEAQYGRTRHFKLGAADYQLFEHLKDRTAYSFCMCPGGVVVAAASEEGGVVTNGMSYHARNGTNANSAFVVSVGPDDFESSHPLAGVEFQRRLERACYRKTGSYAAPVQRLADFISGRPSKRCGVVKPSYTGEVAYTSLIDIFPAYITDSLKASVSAFDRKLKGFMNPDALFTAAETRTSSPVRMLRNELMHSVSFKGLFPAGEGAGYAGGIVSAAVDGIRIAERVSVDYIK